MLFHSDTERSQIAFVTFKDTQGAETAVLLSVIFFSLLLFQLLTFTISMHHNLSKHICALLEYRNV